MAVSISVGRCTRSIRTGQEAILGTVQETIVRTVQHAILGTVGKPVRSTVHEPTLRTGVITGRKTTIKWRLQRSLRLSLLELLQMLLLNRLAPVKVGNCGGSQRTLGEGVVVWHVTRVYVCVHVRVVSRGASGSRFGSVTRRRSLYSWSFHHGGFGCGG